MSKVTLRPISHTDNGSSNATVVGAESAVAAASDDSDSSYLESDTYKGDLFGLTDPELPEGAVVKAVTGRLRMTQPGPSNNGYGNLILGLGGKAIVTGTLSPSSLCTYVLFNSTVTEEQLPAGEAAALALEAGSAQLRIYEVYLDLVYVKLPAVEVFAPSGTVETTNRPSVSWSDTLDSDGGAQTKYLVKVFPASVYEAEDFDPNTSVASVESGVVSSSGTTWTPGEVLADGDYRAYVSVAQTVNGADLWAGSWAYGAFSVEVALPAEPTLSLTPEAGAARIRLAIDQGSEGAATTEGLAAQWSQDDGATWVDLRTAEGEGLMAGTSATLYDYEAPNGSEVKYRARAWHEYEGGERAWSAWVEDEGAWESADRWLKHPTNPGLNLKVEPYSYPGSTRAGRMGNFQPLGRSDAVVVSDTRQARTGSLVLWVDDEEGQDALDGPGHP